jgi:hypothetical protein
VGKGAEWGIELFKHGIHGAEDIIDVSSEMEMTMAHVGNIGIEVPLKVLERISELGLVVPCGSLAAP